MANKYALNAKAILLNNGTEQLLPVSKAKLIELAKSQQGQFGDGVVDVEGALSYLLGQDATNLAAANKHTDDSIAALDSSVAARTGYVLSGITEVDGKLTAYTETWLDASIVSYNGESNVNTALTDIYGQLAAISGGGTGSIQDKITSAIGALDVTEIKEAGKAIVSVSETDGKIAATAGNVDAQYVDVNNANNKFKFVGENANAEKVSAQATLDQLQKEIEAVDAAAAKYAIEEVSVGIPETVAHRYQLSQTISGKKEQAGAFIDIPKDSSLKEVYLGFKDDTVDETSGKVTQTSTGDAQSLNFVYHLENGKYSLTKIDVSKFLSESEFADGLNVNGGKVSVKIAEDSENFLTVGADGVKLSGVQSAINTAKEAAQTYTGSLIAALDSEIAAKTENDFSYVMTGVTETDGKLTNASYIGLSDVTVKTTSFANEELAALLGDDMQSVTDIHKALNKIAGKVSAGATNAVTDVKGGKGTYVEVTAAKSNNTVTLTVDDSALGNVAALKYDVLASDVESVTILG